MAIGALLGAFTLWLMRPTTRRMKVTLVSAWVLGTVIGAPLLVLLSHVVQQALYGNG